MSEFCMPSLGADMEVGSIIEWYVSVGDEVKRGDVIALVDTEKAEIEVEIWEAGKVTRILVETGQEVPVGTPLLALGEDGVATGVPIARDESTSSPLNAAPVAPPPQRRAVPTHRDQADFVRATPFARRRAVELGVDLDLLDGSGPGGRIRVEDVEASGGRPREEHRAPVTTRRASAPLDKTEAGTARLSSERLTAIRRGMATAMARSKREIPHFHLEQEIDLTPALAWLEDANRERSVKDRWLLPLLLLKATALALRHVPELNGHWLDDTFQPASGVHLGVAIAVRGGGLLAPALHDVDSKGLDTLMPELAELAERTRRAQLRSSEVSDATATVTSLGARGADRVFGVIYPPQVALVGFGAARERPWVDAGELTTRTIMSATLAADHRASDGQQGSRLLARIARELAEPERLR